MGAGAGEAEIEELALENIPGMSAGIELSESVIALVDGTLGQPN
jgi:hypothetical protein